MVAGSLTISILYIGDDYLLALLFCGAPFSNTLFYFWFISISTFQHHTIHLKLYRSWIICPLTLDNKMTHLNLCWTLQDAFEMFCFISFPILINFSWSSGKWQWHQERYHRWWCLYSSISKSTSNCKVVLFIFSFLILESNV